MERPADLFARGQEWSDLDGLATSGNPGLDLGIVYGRRRAGKSYLLRRVVEATGGLYSLALEEERRPALDRFTRVVADALDLPGELRVDDWTRALRIALGLGGRGPGRLVVLDEFPYLMRTAPELPSAIQAVYDDARNDPSAPAAQLILCGSAFSVMSELLSGGHPLRGRARLDLLVRPFGYRAARRFWGIDDLEVAVRLNAVLGGTAGYRELTGAAPQSLPELDDWLAAYPLNPSHALFGEADYLLREDPRITDRALYHSVLSAIAAGATTPSAVAATLGRPARSLWHPLDVLQAAGFVRRAEDVLARRKPVYSVADPVIRFAATVIRPRQQMYEERRAAQAWTASQDVFGARVLGPHVEDLAREWTARHASEATLGGRLSVVGHAVVNDATGRAQHEIDVVGLDEDSRPQAARAVIRVLGEAKSTTRRRSVADLARLERIREVLARLGHDVSSARLVLFSRAGFDASLTEVANRRDDVQLVDLERLYRGD